MQASQQSTEYLSAIFYLASSFPPHQVCALVHSLISHSLEVLRPPPAVLTLYPSDPFLSSSPPWAPNAELGSSCITVPHISWPTRAALDVLLDPPEGVHRIYLSNERAGARTRGDRLAWSIGYTPEQRGAGVEGEILDAIIDIHFDTSLFDCLQEQYNESNEMVDYVFDPRARIIVDRIVDVLGDQEGVYAGNVEIVNDTETSGGLYYVNPSLSQRPIPWHRQIEHAVWANAGMKRQSCVRRVTWGNFLGEPVTRRLPDPSQWMTQFRGFHCNPQAGHPGTQWLKNFNSGAMFLAMSENPLTVSNMIPCSEGILQAEWITAAWLHRELRAAGLLL